MEIQLSCLKLIAIEGKEWKMPEATRVKHYRKRKQLPMAEYYDEMRRLGCFTLQDISRMVGERSIVTYVINEYQSKGFIERIHRNLYIAMDIETGQPMLNRYQIGSRLFEGAYLSHYSAFEVWGYAPRLRDEIYVATETRFTDFKYNGVFYRRVNPKEASETEWVAGSLVTSLEQTVVDSINNFDKIAGLEAVAECIMRLPKLDVDKLLGCLEKYGNGYLYQKCGYVLEQLQEYVDLPERFYRECREHCASTVRYMIKGAEGLVYHKEWGIYAPYLIHEQK